MADEVIYRGYNEEIDVNMVPGGPMSVWHSSQYDELRKLRVNLYNGKALQYLGSGVTVSLSVRKTDGNIIESSDSNVIKIVTENPWGEGSAPWRFIEINTTQQMTACVGKNICEIVVYETVSGETSRVGSANFILEVERDPLAGGIQSDSEIDDLQAMVEEALDGTTLGDLGDVSISGKQEGDTLRYDPTAQEWRNVRVYAKIVEVPANTTLFNESFTLKSSDVGKDIRIYVYRNSFSGAAPVNVSGSPRTNNFDVYVSMEAESYVSYWRIELEVCEKESTHPSEAPLPDTVWGWHLKAQLSSGGGGGSGHTILDDGGNNLPTRTKLQFKGAYSADNSTSQTTEVNVVRNMTKAEFDLLPAAEKVGLINITDITSGRNDRFQPVIYSEEEQEIGVWTDGKPLYKKTFFFETVANEYKDLDDLNIETVCKIDYVGDVGSRKIKYSTGSASSSETAMVKVEYDRSSTPYMRLSCTIPSGNDKTAIITLHYTKTTDTAGSGKWTPQGVPAVHYSTDEQIVGTWIDGKTLYQKVVTGLSINVTNEWTNALALSGIDTLVTAIARSDYGQCEIRSQYYNNNIQLCTATGTQSVSSLIIQYTKATS